ncbi:hypothetical protein DL771_010007 [Monosporascus sp. 5C6A]|nr:hypothetical protein DL771_010007 [Monosporascus sp. 5C6A]
MEDSNAFFGSRPKRVPKLLEANTHRRSGILGLRDLTPCLGGASSKTIDQYNFACRNADQYGVGLSTSTAPDQYNSEPIELLTGLHQVPASSLPSSWQGMKDRLPRSGDSTYVFFVVDNDASTGKPWCPDVREALPVVEKYFEQRGDLEVSIVSVGSRSAWKDPENIWRTNWALGAVPTLVKYTGTGGEGEGVVQSQLVEEETKHEDKLRAFTQQDTSAP